MAAGVRRALGSLGERRSTDFALDQLSTLAGINVTERTALTFAAVYSAINVIATDVAALSLHVLRRRADGGRELDVANPLWDIVHVAANDETDAFRFRQSLMGHVLGWGNGYAEIEWLNSGQVGALRLLDPSRTRTARDRAGKLWYEQDSGPSLKPYRVVHVAGLGFDGLRGYSPIKQAKESIALGKAAESFGAAFFGNGATGRGILSTPQKLSKEAKARLREEVDRVHRGVENAHRLMVFEQGLKFESTIVEPEAAQFLETRRFQVIEICRIFRVPPHKLMDLERATFSNIEEQNLDYVSTTLLGWVRAIEAQFNFKLFTADDRRAGLYVKHNMADLLRGNMLNRAQFYRTMVELGVFSANDVATLEDHNPTAGGDEHFRPANLLPLGAVAPTPAKTPADPAANPTAAAA
jgi:HK97 family phage portal protein